MSRAQFDGLVFSITGRLQGRALDAALQTWLNDEYAPGTADFDALVSTCRAAIAEGWMCNREGGGIRYGRVTKPGPASHGFSVDVVDMDNVVGPHHAHPNGEIDLVMPLSPDAKFDGHGAGWCVYGPGSAHYPSVAGGRALVLYLLPEGSIVFS